LKDRLVEAVNKKDENAILAELNPQIWFTAMNNETFHGIDAGKAYYEKMLSGASRIVEDMSIKVEPDDLAVLYNNNATAISTGQSNTHFKLATGQEFDVPLRYSATLVNDGQKWTLANIQFTANMFQNPILSALQSFAYWLAGGAGLVGLALGWLIGRMRKRS
jgi:ketosteroid isomerase-like protein